MIRVLGSGLAGLNNRYRSRLGFADMGSWCGGLTLLALMCGSAFGSFQALAAVPLNLGQTIDEAAGTAKPVIQTAVLNVPKEADEKEKDSAGKSCPKLRHRQPSSCPSAEKWLTELARGMDRDTDTGFGAGFLDDLASPRDRDGEARLLPLLAGGDGSSPAWILLADGRGVYGAARPGPGWSDLRWRNPGWHDDSGSQRVTGGFAIDR